MTNHFLPSSLIPLYLWRGARPWLLDLEADQTGLLICLSLQREGDNALLPLVWQHNRHDFPPDDDNPAPAFPSLHSEALDQHAVAATLSQLKQEGWQVNGRLHLTFTGSDVEPDFDQITSAYLWQTTEEKDEIRNTKYENS